MMDELDELVNEINAEHDMDVERWVQAIDARLERIRRWGGGQKEQNEGSRVREGVLQGSFVVIPGRGTKP